MATYKRATGTDYASADHTGAIHGRNIGTETAATSLGSNVGGGKVTYR